MEDLGLRALSAVGFCVMIAIAWACSSDRRAIRWSTVAWGCGLQVLLGIALLRSPLRGVFFPVIETVVGRLLAYTQAGSDFVFGSLFRRVIVDPDSDYSFLLQVLPVIIFMGSLFAVLYHLGLVQRVVDALARVLAKTMRISGAEGLTAVANVFVGMIESALIVRPYLERLTRSELFALMTLGMATVAGSVLVAYVKVLGPEYAGHLVTASLISAPAGLLIAKIMIPETEVPESGGGAHAHVESAAVNVIDAAAEGAMAGLRMAAYVGTLVLAFVALIAMANDALGTVGSLVGVEGLSFQQVFGWLLAPIALLMGVAPQDAVTVGGLLGVKTVLNEFLAYIDLAGAMQPGGLSQRSAVIASYALCGFANFGSLAIMIGGISAMAPGRRHDVARLGLRSILAGSLATFMTGCVAGVFL